MAEVSGYSRAQIALHWGVVVLLIVSFLSREAMGDAFDAAVDGKEIGAATLSLVHRLVGVLVFVLALTRVVLRFRHGAPALPAGGNPLLDRVAKATHLGLYTLILVMPLSGFIAWQTLNSTVGEAHETMFKLLFLLTALHVIGALYHQFVLKDGLMERMKRPG